MDDGPELLRVGEVAKRLNVSRTKAYELISGPDPEIPSLRIGRSRRIPRQLLNEWMARQIERARALNGR